MDYDIVEVTSWLDLQEELFRGSWNASLERYRSHYAYRGLSEQSYTLETSLMRMGGDYHKLEGQLIRNFRKYAQSGGFYKRGFWHWVSVAQHHGLPTRLLDWTYSPYVALHFATANTERFDCDGVIWAVDYVKVHRLLPEELHSTLQGADVFTANMLDRNVGDFQGLDQLSTKDLVVFFEPPSLDDRIVNQYALFSVMSNPKAVFSRWLKEHPKLWRKIIIPASLKWEARDKLDQANITERVLFPGFDGLSTWLKRHYSPKA